MGPDASSFEGPRGTRREESESMLALVNSVFTRGTRADMYELFPVLFADENLEKPSGRGIMLMRTYMDTVQFNERGNQVRLVKKRC